MTPEPETGSPQRVAIHQNQEKGDKTPGDEVGSSGGNGQDNYIN